MFDILKFFRTSVYQRNEIIEEEKSQSTAQLEQFH